MSTYTPFSPTTIRSADPSASICLLEKFFQKMLNILITRSQYTTTRADADVLMQATRNVIELAASVGRLRSFVHLSTAYVNCDRQRGSHVEETIYPFDLSGCRPRCSAPGAGDEDSRVCSCSDSSSNISGDEWEGCSSGVGSWWGLGSLSRSFRDFGISRSLWSIFGGGRGIDGKEGKQGEIETDKLLRQPEEDVDILEAVEALVAELMALPPDAAARRVRVQFLPNAAFPSCAPLLTANRSRMLKHLSIQ